MNPTNLSDIFLKILQGNLSNEELNQILDLDREYFRTLILSISEKCSIFERSHARIETIFSASPQPILIIDDHTRITNINPSFLKISGYSRDEILGKPLNEFSPEISAMMVTDQDPEKMDFITVNFPAGKRVLEQHTIPVTSPSGTGYEFILIFNLNSGQIIGIISNLICSAIFRTCFGTSVMM